MAKTSSKKKGATKKKSASKAKSAPKAQKTVTAKGAEAAKETAGKAPPKKGKKKVSAKDLLLKQFDAWQPEALYAPPAKEAVVPNAPPIAAGENADQIKALLLKPFKPGPEPDVKKAPVKKKAAAPKEKAAAKSPKKAAKAPATKKAQPSIRELLSRRFDDWTPGFLYVPPSAAVDAPSAPPIAVGSDAERVKSLLLRQFDLEEIAAAAVEPPEPAPEPEPPAPREPASPEELRNRRFALWQPERLYAPPLETTDVPSAPPIATGPDAERVKSLLLRQFDLEEIAAAAVEPPEPAPEPEPPAPREPASPEELRNRRFALWQPETLYAPPLETTDVPSAPPIATGPDAERVKSLLLRQFDLEEIAAAAVEPPEPEPVRADNEPPAEIAAIDPEPAAEAPEEKAALEEAPKPETTPDKEPDTATVMRETAEKVVRPAPVYQPEVEWEASGSAAQEKSEAQVPPTPPHKKGSDPMERSMKFLAACAIVLLAIMIGTSFSNASKYYLKSTEDGLEIWKGSFAPMGTERVIRLPGATAPDSIQGVFTKEQVMPIAFNYYMDKAKQMLYSQGVADYEKVKKYIDKALYYADAKIAKQAFAMQKNMRILSLMTMADVAASKTTAKGYQEAVAIMEKAAKLDENDLIDMGRTRYTPIIEKKLSAYKALLADAVASESKTQEAAKTE